jgi:hypothetical protein
VKCFVEYKDADDFSAVDVKSNALEPRRQFQDGTCIPLRAFLSSHSMIAPHIEEHLKASINPLQLLFHGHQKIARGMTPERNRKNPAMIIT